MRRFYCFLSKIDLFFSALSLFIGRSSAWLCALMVVLTTGIVVTRALFNLNHGGIQESLTYMHCMVIALASAYTLHHGGHIRVDIFYRRFNRTQKAWVDALGSILLLLPTAIFIFVISFDFVLASWRTLETSPDPNGIPAVFLLKSLLLVLGGLLSIQALAELARALIQLSFIIDTPKTDDANSPSSNGSSHLLTDAQNPKI